VKRIPLPLELVSILIGQGVQPLASPRDDGVGILPVGSQLSLILMPRGLNHALKDEVSDLNSLDFTFLWFAARICLIGPDVDLGMLSFLRVIQLKRVKHCSGLRLLLQLGVSAC